MHYGFVTPNWGDYGDPRLLAELAYEAEAAGWEGFFIWDHIKWPAQDPTADPWVALAAMAMRTERIRLGPMVTSLPRRRPWKLARETVTLDHLSGGRLILGVGSGYFPQEEFEAFGEAGDVKVRAAKLDEGLEVLTGLWSGEPFSYAGTYYQVKEVSFAPPVQRPRIPIWVAGTWPLKAPFRRAARWDGVVPIPRDAVDSAILTPSEIRDIGAYIKEHRARTEPFDIVNNGQTQGGGTAEDTAIIAPYIEAGATWWLEYRFPWLSPLAEVRERIRKGPPRV
jgi:alkanesulfonate monooxygenase SsuD/methylene tetrahydromethanopterin reductase-like flavin-dependent oxidoreductase (luciferase family)